MEETRTGSPPETSWDLGPFAAMFATWADLFSSNKMQRRYMGLEITVCMCSWANSGQKKQNKTKKLKKSVMPLLKSQE